MVLMVSCSSGSRCVETRAEVPDMVAPLRPSRAGDPAVYSMAPGAQRQGGERGRVSARGQARLQAVRRPPGADAARLALHLPRTLRTGRGGICSDGAVRGAPSTGVAISVTSGGSGAGGAAPSPRGVMIRGISAGAAV